MAIRPAKAKNCENEMGCFMEEGGLEIFTNLFRGYDIGH